ncbi:MAG TPA: antitoxin VbhA family protein [Duganella sp.]|nr:antitoxin VbhA family protein [Duganella sp.]
MGQPRLRTIEPPLISAEEREKRQTAANFALASVGLEGFQVTDTYKAQLERFINGEIDFAKLIKAAREHT